MSRRVRRRVSSSQDNPTAIIASPAYPGTVEEYVRAPGAVEWTNLPDDNVVQLLSCLSYRDRASLASTCRAFRALAASPCLFADLDLRAYPCNPDTAASLAARCAGLRRLRIRGHDAAASAIYLRARGAIEILAESCRAITDCTLSVLAARHELLETLEIGPDPCEKITSDAVRQVAMCCPRLRRLRLSGVPEIQGEAIEALAHFCPRLEEIAFLDCGSIDQCAIACVSSLRFLSVAGSQDLKWTLAAVAWSKLNLVGVDVSRTDVSASCVLRLLSSANSLKVLCALNCPTVDTERNHDPVAFSGSRGKLLLATFTDISIGIASLFEDPSFNKNDKNLNYARSWVEWILSQSLLRMAETNPHGMDTFWVNQGAALFLNLIKSSQEDVQERAATGLATFVVVDDENATVDPSRAEVVMRNGGIPLLHELTRSYKECLQSEAAKAIANLSVNSKVAKAVAEGGGITILTDLARSTNRLVAEEAAGGLWNLSVGEEHKVAIGEAGGVKALVDLIFKWPSGIDILERAAGALANLAADDKCGIEVAVAGGVRALVMLAQSCKVDGVQEQAARALANMAAHGDSNDNNAAVGQEAGALEALVQLTCSNNEGVRQEAAGALWNLSFDDKNREAIAAAGGVEALVALAEACSNASHGLQERAAGALWGLSVSEANSIAIGSEGGIAPLITLARSDAEDVHETAAGALWNLAFNSGNALRIVEEGGVPALVHLCSSSGSKMARFMAALALAYMFDGRMDEIGVVGSSSEGASKSVNFDGARRVALKQIDTFLLTFSDPHIFTVAAVSSAPAALVQVADIARIQEAGHLRCSGAEIGRFVAMLRNPSSILRACAAFALLQFTVPGGRHAIHHASLLQKAGAARVLRAAAASTTAPIEAKVFARVVLRNLEHHRLEASI